MNRGAGNGIEDNGATWNRQDVQDSFISSQRQVVCGVRKHQSPNWFGKFHLLSLAIDLNGMQEHTIRERKSGTPMLQPPLLLTKTAFQSFVVSIVSVPVSYTHLTLPTKA